MDITIAWHWPQWTVAVLMFLTVFATCVRHGKPRLEISGDRKGEPELFNGFIGILRAILWIFILTCGGFFA